MSRVVQRSLVALSVVFVFLLLPSTALAQFTGAITGVVRDTSGGVLPGVTVEASSPVLIEKVRTVVTDDTGQYRIVDLLTGTYSVTFTLPGFSTVRRDGIEISGTFVATVKSLCLAISWPRSHVNERRSAAGSLRICRVSAATTVAVSLFGTLMSEVNREWRSTSVTMWLFFEPLSRSPSQ